MVSKTLIKLIDFSIFPAVLIIAAKVIGIAFLLRYFQVDYQLDGLRLSITNVEDFIAVNSYSSLFMLAAIVAGIIWVLVKAHVFHDTHITPSLSAKLYGMNMEEIIHSTQTIYSQAFIWLSYAWVATIIFAVQAYFGLAYWWVFSFGLIFSILSSAFIIMDVEREINAARISALEAKSSPSMINIDKISEELLK